MKKLIEALPAWYQKNARELPWRRDREPYHVWLSEIMLQQTRVEAVREYYARFLLELPTVEALAGVSDDRLLKLWQGLGYYNRARNLKKAAIRICEEYGGVFPASYEQLRTLPGVGDYTAGAIASICFDEKTPAVDGNVLRVVSRVLEDAANIDADATKKKVRAALADIYPEKAGMATQALMELGACVCVPNGAPHCDRCPAAKFCLAGLHRTWENYPVRAEKRKRRVEQRLVLLLLYQDKLALCRRPAKGLLAGLWEFPNRLVAKTGRADTPDSGTMRAGKSAGMSTEMNTGTSAGLRAGMRAEMSTGMRAGGDETGEQQAARFAAELGVTPSRLLFSVNHIHIFTHVEWHMKACAFRCEQAAEGLTWASLAELDKEYALPSAFAPFLKAVREIRGD